jgi:DNA mismatch endonuclease (patch repair protein)
VIHDGDGARSVSDQDIVSAEKRSEMMAAVGQKDTPPELAVRRMLTALGRRYRVRNRDLPGSPDIANRSREWAIFVHGCFWHGHRNCPKTKAGSDFRVPATRPEFWREKLETNRRRDARAIRALRGEGFKVVLIWECELRQPEAVATRLGSEIPKST